MKKFLVSCLATLLVATPVLAKPAPKADVAAGLQAMHELNLVVFDTLKTNGQEVEGRTFVGSLVAANFTNFGIGNSKQGSATSNYDVLSVVKNATGSFRLKAGYQNGANGTLGTVAKVGGNVGEMDFNTANGAKGTLLVGGNLTKSFNVNNNVVHYGGTNAAKVNGAVKDSSLASNGLNDIAASLSTQMTALQNNLTGLSTLLSGMTSLGTITSTNSALNFSGAKDGYAVFTMTEAAFTNQNANFDNLFTALPNGITTIINVQGKNLVERGNINNKALNQSVIWNFADAESLTLKGFHGSILAPNASVTNSSAIEGSIIAKNFTLNGEVHLGTYNGTDKFIPSGVPEPATWAMLIFGMGMVGFVARRSSKGRNDVIVFEA